jgi:hypothetical protein
VINNRVTFPSSPSSTAEAKPRASCTGFGAGINMLMIPGNYLYGVFGRVRTGDNFPQSFRKDFALLLETNISLGLMPEIYVVNRNQYVTHPRSQSIESVIAAKGDHESSLLELCWPL